MRSLSGLTLSKPLSSNLHLYEKLKNQLHYVLFIRLSHLEHKNKLRLHEKHIKTSDNIYNFYTVVIKQIFNFPVFTFGT